MAQPRVALEEGMVIKSFPLTAEAVVAATVVEVGDLLRFETNATANLAGVGLFDTATENAKFVGVSKGKTQTTMISGAYGDHIPVVMRGIIECPLSSGSYNFGEGLGYSGTKNTLQGDVATTNPTIAWFYGSDEDTITTGLVLVDIFLLRALFAASV